MEPITEREIRACFVNCSKGEAMRVGLPADLAERPWADLDFLGWRDPGAPDRAYLVTTREDRLVGLSMRATSGGSRGFTAYAMCSICATSRPGGGVVLMTARRIGEAGRQGNTVGQYLCSDLACSLFARGLRSPLTDPKAPAGRPDLAEWIDVPARIARARANLDGFLDRVFVP